jgi:hypothetical protein
MATGPGHLKELGQALSEDGRAALKGFEEEFSGLAQRVLRDGGEPVACEVGGERIEFEAEGSVDPPPPMSNLPLGLLFALQRVGYRAKTGIVEAEKQNPATYVHQRDGIIAPKNGLVFTLVIDREESTYHLFGHTPCVK